VNVQGLDEVVSRGEEAEWLDLIEATFWLEVEWRSGRGS